MKFRVVDVRDKNVLFEHTNKEQCVEFWNELWEEDNTTAIYSTIEKVGSEK